MSGVWEFDERGVARVVENPLAETSFPGPASGHKMLVHVASNERMRSYEQLDAKMLELGWHPYADGDPASKQYHRSPNTPDLITLPISFHSIRTTHMYDIVFKTRYAFLVQDTT